MRNGAGTSQGIDGRGLSLRRRPNVIARAAPPRRFWRRTLRRDRDAIHTENCAARSHPGRAPRATIAVPRLRQSTVNLRKVAETSATLASSAKMSRSNSAARLGCPGWHVRDDLIGPGEEVKVGNHPPLRRQETLRTRPGASASMSFVSSACRNAVRSRRRIAAGRAPRGDASRRLLR